MQRILLNLKCKILKGKKKKKEVRLLIGKQYLGAGKAFEVPGTQIATRKLNRNFPQGSEVRRLDLQLRLQKPKASASGGGVPDHKNDG